MLLTSKPRTTQLLQTHLITKLQYVLNNLPPALLLGIGNSQSSLLLHFNNFCASQEEEPWWTSERMLQTLFMVIFRTCMWLISSSGNVQGQVGQGLEQPGLVENSLSVARGWNDRIWESFPTQTIPHFHRVLKHDWRCLETQIGAGESHAVLTVIALTSLFNVEEAADNLWTATSQINHSSMFKTEQQNSRASLLKMGLPPPNPQPEELWNHLINRLVTLLDF